MIDMLNNKEYKPIIKIYDSQSNIDSFENYDIVLYSVDIGKNDKWAKNQKKRYYLRHGNILADSKSQRINKIPTNHYVEMDIANNKIRLCGPHISPSLIKSQWIYI